MIRNEIQRFLRLPEVLDLIPVGKSTFWAGIKTGRFPQPIKLSPRVTVWREQDIHDYMQQYSKNTDCKGGQNND